MNKSVYIPPGLANVHPGLESALKSIQDIATDLQSQISGKSSTVKATAGGSSSSGGSSTTTIAPSRTFAFWAA
jgi:hypothetical protein